jgi:hypothetical protein
VKTRTVVVVVVVSNLRYISSLDLGRDGREEVWLSTVLHCRVSP